MPDDLRNEKPIALDRVERSIAGSPVLPSHATAAGRRRAIRMTALVLLGVVVLFAAYRIFAQHMVKEMMARPQPPTPITAAVADARAMPKFLTGIGTLQAVHQVMVAPEIGGRITQIFFQPGAMVKEGDPLIQLNDAPERGDLANYQAQLRLAAANLGRDKALSARDFQSRQVVDQQQSLLDQAQANIAKTEAQIAQKLIKAPFSGQLGVRQVEVGAYLNPGGAVVTLTDLSTLWVNFTLPEQMSSQIRVGQSARIRADAFPGRSFEAKVTAIEPQISAQTRTLLVQATLDNSDHALLPGMYANVDVAMPSVPDTVTVPETAVDYSLYGDVVFVVHEAGKDDSGQPIFKVTRTFVKTGDHFDGRVAIVSGLKAGDRVAASGQLKLTNETVVTVLPGDVLSQPPATNAF